VGAVAVLDDGYRRFVANDGSAFGDSIIRKAIRHTAMHRFATSKQQNAPHEGEAFGLQRWIR